MIVMKLVFVATTWFDGNELSIGLHVARSMQLTAQGSLVILNCLLPFVRV